MQLSIYDAEYHYKDAFQNGFSHINLTVEDKEVLCILGPNGCGKTTLLKSLINLLPLQKGNIFLDQKDISVMNRTDIAKIIGYVPQMHQPTFSYNVLDVVLLGRTAHLDLFAVPGREDVALAEEALRIMGIYHLKDKPYTEISGGERQMVMFARVITQQPKILLLDEPTSHLDFGNQIRLLKVIEGLAKRGLSIIMTTHFPDHAFIVADRVALMEKGSLLACGLPDEVITEENLYRLYNVPVEIKYIDDEVKRKVCIPLA
jgi:iron complex transport system ATP-binding protein